jgi:hypothetical protein
MVSLLAALWPSSSPAAECPTVPAKWVSAPRAAYASPVRAARPRSGFALASTQPYLRFGDAEHVTWLRSKDELTTVAAPSEREAVTFAIVASRTIRNVKVEVSDLVGDSERIPADSITVRSIRHAALRKTPAAAETELAPRFLPAWKPTTIHRKHFREVWIDVPADVPPGSYRGTVTIRSDRGVQKRPFLVQVRDVVLVDEPAKALGMYYAIGRAANEAAVRRELADMHAHGVRHLVTPLRPIWIAKDDAIIADTKALERALEQIHTAGFRGTVVVESGFVQLAWKLGHTDVGFNRAKGESLDGAKGEPFRNAAIEGLHALERLDEEYDDLDLAVVHLDEIFNADRLDLFLRFAELTWGESPLRQFAAVHTADDASAALMERVDLYVGLRSQHGYSFEWWLERGHTIGEYASALRKSGDRAWYYHNDRGSFFRPSWARIVNGMWLWVSPFEAHVPWIYQRFDGNPLDDTDCRWHDFGFAFPDPKAPHDLVPTLAWEATRDGFDDLRYLATLEREIASARRRRDPAAEAAERFLAELRKELVSALPVTDVATQRRRVGTEGEAPYVSRIAKRFGSSGLASVRQLVADHIHTLQASRRASAARATR